MTILLHGLKMRDCSRRNGVDNSLVRGTKWENEYSRL